MTTGWSWIGGVNNVSAVWSQAMLRTCWQGSLFLAAIWAICRAANRTPSSFRGGLWWLACLKLVVCLGFAIPISLSFMPQSTVQQPVPQEPLLPAASSSSNFVSELQAPKVSSRVSSRPSIGSARVQVSPSTQRVELPGPINPKLNLASLLMGFWFVGASVRIILLIRQGARARMLVRHAQPCRTASVRAEARRTAAAVGLRGVPELLASDDVSGPVLIGIFWPAILLPARDLDALSPEELRMAFAHEFSHLKRRDPLLALVPVLASALFFFHPLVWLACREYDVCREEACDAQTLRATQSAAEVYGRLILRFIAQSRQVHSGLALGTTHLLLQRRISMLQHVSPVVSRSTRAVLGSLLTIGLLAAIPWRVVAKPQEQKDALAGDARLDRKVAVSAEGVSLADLMKLLAEKTGAPLEAWSNLADDKIIVFSPSRPLRELMTDVAALYNARWIHGKKNDGKEYYAITQLSWTKDYEDKLANATHDRVVSLLDAQVQALNETPEQLAKRAQGDPIRQNLADHTIRLATELYGGLTNEQRKLLFEETTLNIPYAALSPQMQDAVRKQQAENIESIKQYYIEHPDLAHPRAAISDEVEKQGITFTISEYFGSINIAVHPAGLLAAVKAQTQWELPAHGDPYSLKPILKNAALPQTEATAFARKEAEWPDQLRKLAQSSGEVVMADYYRSKPVVRPYGSEEVDPRASETVQAMDGLCFPEGYLWWTHDKTLLLRKRDWYTQKQYEVPDSWLLALEKRLHTQMNIPGYREMFSLLNLTRRQIVGLSSYQFRTERSDRLTAGELNEHDVMGLHEFLELAQTAWGDQDRTLPTSRASDADGPELATLDGAALNKTQHDYLASFVSRRDNPLKFSISKSVFLRMLCTGYRIPGDHGFHEGYSDVDMELTTVPGRDLNTGFWVRLPMPTEIPDDRRDKTKVEVMP